MNGEEGTAHEEEDDADERRERALASAQPLQPGFKPTRISHHQLSKLHELHQRRLKVKTKFHKKLKDGTKRSYSKDPNYDDGKNSVRESELLKASNMEKGEGSIGASAEQDKAAAQSSQKKRQKLHWGLDTRERWERKANM